METTTSSPSTLEELQCEQAANMAALLKALPRNKRRAMLRKMLGKYSKKLIKGIIA